MLEISNRAITFCNVPCTNCGTTIPTVATHQSYQYRKTGRVFCKPSCGYAHRDARRNWPKPKFAETKCHWCGVLATPTGAQLTAFKKHGRAYCSRACSQAYVVSVSSKTASATNRKYASQRMLTNNPMRNLESRQRMSESLRKIGHGPSVRGGNGKGLTVAESILAESLSAHGFVANCIVKTKMPRGSGFPPCYKIDIGNSALKIGVEADGSSHASRRHLDAKKDAFLAGLGWKILRFSNHAILNCLENVVSTIVSTTSM